MKEAFLPPEVTNRSKYKDLYIDLDILEQVCSTFDIPRNEISKIWIAFRDSIPRQPKTLGLFIANRNHIKIATEKVIKMLLFTFRVGDCEFEAPIYYFTRTNKLHKYLVYTNSRPETWNRRDRFLASFCKRVIERNLSIILFHELIHFKQSVNFPNEFQSDSNMQTLLKKFDRASRSRVNVIGELIRKTDPWEKETEAEEINFLTRYPQFHELVKINLPK